MTDIDLATGLPTLPSGQHWRVAKNRDSFSGRSFVTVQVIERVPTRKREYLNLWLFEIPIGWSEGEHIKVAYEWPVWDPNSVVSDDDDGVLIVAPDGTKYLPIDPYKLTPEDILRTAEAAMAKNAEFEKAKALLGDYPPKTLNMEKN